jgi:hypothetical protein
MRPTMATYRYGISIEFRRFIDPGSRKESLQKDEKLGTATLIIAQNRDRSFGPSG